MKKILAVFLALLLLIPLTSCQRDIEEVTPESFRAIMRENGYIHGLDSKAFMENEQQKETIIMASNKDVREMIKDDDYEVFSYMYLENVNLDELTSKYEKKGATIYKKGTLFVALWEEKGKLSLFTLSNKTGIIGTSYYYDNIRKIFHELGYPTPY